MKHPLLSILAALAITGCAGTLGPSPSATAMTTTAATAPSSNGNTFCLGRFLIDMPQGARLHGAGYKYDFAQIEKPKAMSLEQFNKVVNEREAQLKAVKHRVEPSLLRQTVRPNASSRILVFWEQDFTSAGVEIEGYRWIDGTRFLVTDEADTEKQALAVERMEQIVSGLRPRTVSDIPTDPGYCFEGGFIANERWKSGEEIDISFRFPDHPGAALVVQIYPLRASRRDPPLLDRVGGVMGAIGAVANRVQVLRRGDKAVGGFKGQEYLVAGSDHPGKPGQLFTWETQGEGTLQEPVIKIELRTGKVDDKGNPQATRWSNEEAMAVWDRILMSFKVRPVSSSEPKKTSDAGPSTPTSPVRAATGEPCPASGEWDCSDHGNAMGSKALSGIEQSAA